MKYMKYEIYSLYIKIYEMILVIVTKIKNQQRGLLGRWFYIENADFRKKIKTGIKFDVILHFWYKMSSLYICVSM